MVGIGKVSSNLVVAVTYVRFEVSNPILSIIPEQITSFAGMLINWYFMEELPEFIITILRF
jgi:hypothetical protein